MPTYVSASLLATYLAAAAREVVEGSQLSDRSRWAIAHAKRQLADERDILLGVKRVRDRSAGAALRTSGAAGGPSLTTLVLQSAPDATDRPLKQTELEARAAGYLTQVVEDLDAVSTRTDPAAGRRLAEALAAPRRRAA